MRFESGIAEAGCRLAAAALIQPLAWELPYALGVALKRKQKQKQKKTKQNSPCSLEAPKSSQERETLDLSSQLDRNSLWAVTRVSKDWVAEHQQMI